MTARKSEAAALLQFRVEFAGVISGLACHTRCSPRPLLLGRFLSCAPGQET